MSDSQNKKTVFIDCSFEEKDAAKKVGARWEFSVKKWYVPENLWSELHRFNKWRPNGRIYLNCPFKDKDRAKKKGARWDGNVKQWYFVPSKTRCEEDFREWLGENTITSRDDGGLQRTPSPQKKPKVSANSTMKETKPPEKISSTTTPKKKEKLNTKEKSKQEAHTTVSLASLPRINIDMTKPQLQKECRTRDPSIKGISSKDKQWLMDYLVIGSVWISADNMPKVSATAIIESAKKRKIQEESQKKSNSPKKPKLESKAPISKTSLSVDVLKALPRVTASLTIAELNHELHCRDSSVKGTSNKNKQWFMDRLGIGSVQISSVDAKDYDFQMMPRISNSLTVAQLSREVLERNPSQTGLSGKSKGWFLEKLGVGSLWTTSSNHAAVGAATKNSTTGKAQKTKGVVPMKIAIEKDCINADNNTTNTGVIKSSKGKVTKKQTKSCDKQLNKTTQALKKDKATKTSLVKKEPEPEISCSTCVKVKREAILSTKLEKPSSMSKKNDYMPENVASSSSNVPCSKRAMNTKNRKEEPAKKQTETSIKREEKEKTVQVKKKVNMEPRLKTSKVHPALSIPVVSSSMTIVQLKEESKVRNGETKGLSGKSKTWLLDYLSIGSELEGSIEWQRRSDEETQKLHVYKSLCHPHPLADTHFLRVAKVSMIGTRCSRKRIDTARCNIGYSCLCETKPYRTCEKCDFDVCKVCYEINSLPNPEKDQLLQDKYVQINKERQEAQERFEERQRQLEEEEKQREAKWEKERQLEKVRLAEKYAKDIAKFPLHVRCPGPKQNDITKKLKYTVYTLNECDRDDFSQKEFDSSYNCLEEANQRVEYVFFFENMWEKEKDDMYADIDKINASFGTRFMSCKPDGYRSSWTVSVAPSATFDFLSSLEGMDYKMNRSYVENKMTIFPRSIREPPAKHRNANKKLKYTVYTLNEYCYDNFTEKEFDSSYSSLEEANQRVEYIFYYENVWGLGIDEIHAEYDEINSSYGTRLMSVLPDGYKSSWTVSVVPSPVFEFMVSSEDTNLLNNGCDNIASFF